MKTRLIIIISIVVVLIGLTTVGYYFSSLKKYVICPQETKLCSDGSFVSRIGPNCEFASCPKEDLMRIFAPKAYEEISSPLLIQGEARGFWFFEADFPVKLLDEEGNVIAEHYAIAKGEWITKDFVPFESKLIFETPKTRKGWLILQKDNPSDMRELDDALRIPIVFSQTLPQIKTVKLYYYNPNLDKDETGNILCSRNGLVAVEREILLTKTPIQETIELLLKGELTEAEKKKGITTEFPLEGFKLLKANLKEGILTLQFDNPYYKTSGGSCRVGILWFQIEQTSKQFAEIKEVKFSPEELFQP